MSVYANHFLIITSDSDYDTTHIEAMGLTPIIRDAPMVEGNMKQWDICPLNFVGWMYHLPTRTLTIQELQYINNRVRKIKIVE